MFSTQLQYCLRDTVGTRVGMVIGEGYNPNPDNGQALAKSALAVLRQEFKNIVGSNDLFSGAALRDLHVISEDAYLNGTVDVDLYFLADSRVGLPTALLGTTCTPPPKTYCMGDDSAQKLVVYNWDSYPILNFKLDDKNYPIKPARGTGNGDDRTVGCITVSPGIHAWGSTPGISGNNTLKVEAGVDPAPIQLCGNPMTIGGLQMLLMYYCFNGKEIPYTGGAGSESLVTPTSATQH